MLRLLDYILPFRCVNCSRILPQGNIPLCQSCFHSLPFTHWPLNQDNPTYATIRASAEILNASSLLFYRSNNAVKRLIMSNKYYNQPWIGKFFAEIAFSKLQRHSFDVITCIPSHSRTKRQRGYNQVELFAKHLSQKLEVKYDDSLIKRIKRRDSQTHKNKMERFTSLKDAFVITDTISENQRVLLLDDVLTTGATLSSCCSNLLTKHPTIQLSVFTIAKVI